VASRSRARARDLLPRLASQPADEDEVLKPGERLVHRGVLSGQPDELPDLVRVRDHVMAADRRAPAVGPQQRGHDPHRGGLSCAVRAQEAEYRTGAYGQVDPVQCDGPPLEPEPLDQPFGNDCVSHGTTVPPCPDMPPRPR
jgi:hypothetical protein